MKKQVSLQELQVEIDKSIDEALTLVAETKKSNFVPAFDVNVYKIEFKSQINDEIAKFVNEFERRFRNGISLIWASLSHLDHGKQSGDRALAELQKALDTLRKENENIDAIDERMQTSQSIAAFMGFSEDTLREFYKAAYDLRHHNHIKEAADCFYSLCTLSPWTPTFWLSYGNCEQILTHYMPALHAYAMAALVDAKDPTPHYLAAQCYEQLGDHNEAVYSLDLAIGCANEDEPSKLIKKKSLELKQKISNYR